MKSWKLEDAKNRFSEVVRRAECEGPQLVTKYGRDSAVVLAARDYRRMIETGDLAEFLSTSPFAEALREGELRLRRSREPGRSTDFDLSPGM
ncbi:MAG: type II toxin-antitoxin system Phd/YefM family antitoxin [Gemmatimonadota bacterium]|jgi:prevent-host-death family protein